MNDFDIREKEMNHLINERKRAWNKVAIGLIALGLVTFVGGAIFNGIAGDKYKEETVDVSQTLEEIDDFDGEGIKNIDIDIGAGRAVFVASDDGDVHIEGSNVPADHKFEVNGDTLKIELVKDWNGSVLGWDNNLMEVTVRIPAKEYSRVDLDAGAGDIQLYDISCETAQIKVGAGSAVINDLKCKKGAKMDSGAGEITVYDIHTDDRLELTVGVGSMDIDNAYVAGLKTDIGVGELDFNGIVNGDIDAKCGVGNCTIDLENTKSDLEKYKVRTDCGLGNLEINYADVGGEEPEIEN